MWMSWAWDCGESSEPQCRSLMDVRFEQEGLDIHRDEILRTGWFPSKRENGNALKKAVNKHHWLRCRGKLMGKV